MPKPSPHGPSLREGVLSAFVVLILTGAALWILLGPGQFRTDPLDFMPGVDDDAAAMVSETARAVQASNANLILAAIEGGQQHERLSISREMADSLREDPRIHRVLNGSTDAAWRQADTLQAFRYRYLLGSAVERGHLAPDHLQTSLEQRLAELSMPTGGPERDWMRADPTGAWRLQLAQWFAHDHMERRHGLWVSANGQQALFAVELQSDLSDAEQAGVLRDIRALFDTRDAPPEATLLLTGAPVFMVESSQMIRDELRHVSIAATVIVMVVLLLAFRSVRLLALTGLPLIAGILCGTALVLLVFGHLHGIALAFGIILVGVSLDYPLHVFSHRVPDESTWVTIRRLWPTLRLGTLTTLLGFGAMALAPMQGLAQMGVFALGGLPAALMCSRYLLPWLTPPPTPMQPWLSTQRLWLWNLRPPRHGQALTMVLAILAMTVMLTKDADLWKDGITHFNPVPEATRQADRTLRQAMGGSDLRYHAVISAAHPQAVLEKSAALALAAGPMMDSGAIQGLDHPAQWLPPVSWQAYRQDLLPDAETLEAHIRAAAQASGFRPDAFEPFLEDVAISRTLPPLGPGDLEPGWHAQRLENTLFATGDHWRGIVRFHGLEDPEAVKKWIEGLDMPGARFVDVATHTTTQMALFRVQVLTLMGIGLLLMAGLLWTVLGSGRLMLRILLPPVTATLVTAAWVSLGSSLSVFHLVSLLLVVGLGLDYALFFVRHSQDTREARRTRSALVLCLLSTLGLFGIMAVSGIEPLGHIGHVVSLGALLAFCAAWLTSPDPRHNATGLKTTTE